MPASDYAASPNRAYLKKTLGTSVIYCMPTRRPVGTSEFFFVYGCGEKIELKGPKLHTQGPPGTCQGGLGEYARPPKRPKIRES